MTRRCWTTILCSRFSAPAWRCSSRCAPATRRWMFRIAGWISSCARSTRTAAPALDRYLVRGLMAHVGCEWIGPAARPCAGRGDRPHRGDVDGGSGGPRLGGVWALLRAQSQRGVRGGRAPGRGREAAAGRRRAVRARGRGLPARAGRDGAGARSRRDRLVPVRADPGDRRFLREPRLAVYGEDAAVAAVDEMLQHAREDELPMLLRYLSGLRASLLADAGRVGEAERTCATARCRTATTGAWTCAARAGARWRRWRRSRRSAPGIVGRLGAAGGVPPVVRGDGLRAVAG